MMMTPRHPRIEEVETRTQMTPVGVGTPARTGMTLSWKTNAATGGSGAGSTPTGQDDDSHRRPVIANVELAKETTRKEAAWKEAAWKEADTKERASEKRWKKAEDPTLQVPDGLTRPSPVQGPMPLPRGTLPCSEQKQTNLILVPDTQEAGGQGRATERGIFQQCLEEGRHCEASR